MAHKSRACRSPGSQGSSVEQIKGVDAHLRRSLEAQAIRARKAGVDEAASGFSGRSSGRSTSGPVSPALGSAMPEWDSTTSLAPGPRPLRHTVVADMSPAPPERFTPLSSTRYHAVSPKGEISKRGSPRALAEARALSAHTTEREVAQQMVRAATEKRAEWEAGWRRKAGGPPPVAATAATARALARQARASPPAVDSKAKLDRLSRMRREVMQALGPDEAITAGLAPAGASEDGRSGPLVSPSALALADKLGISLGGERAPTGKGE